MKLLLCTQTVDPHDPHLGFFQRWIEEFAAHCEQVTVICLREGSHALPSNVRVYSLGKTNKLVRAVRFLRLSWKLRKDYDAVFVHMNPEYVALGGWMWRLQGKKIALWYAHKSITLKLRVAVLLATSICSVTMKSFPIATSKLHALGHGVDTQRFAYQPRISSDTMRLLTVGRIASSKHVLEMLTVVELLKEAGMSPQLTIAGEAGTDAERSYKEKLITEIERRSLQSDVRLLGAVPHAELPRLLAQHDVFLNFSTTGNMDKAGFEPLAMGLPLVSTNTAFKDILEPHGLYAPLEDPTAIVAAIQRSQSVPIEPLMRYTREQHALSGLIPKILKTLV